MSTHWTETTIDDFVHRLSFDFITQLAKRLEASPINQTDLAEFMQVTKGRVSQILNNPGNITLRNAVKYARGLGMKVSLVAYDDHDPTNQNGPVNSEIFTVCWERAGYPTNFGALETVPSSATTVEKTIVFPHRKPYVMTGQAARVVGERIVVAGSGITLGELVTSTNEDKSFAVAGG
jgi:transcriptional regulator with XRE-family HTH domain